MNEAPLTDWVDVLEALLAGEDLNAPTTTWVMAEMLTGSAPPANTAAFLVALRAKGETAREVSGLVTGMMNASVPLDIEGPVVDTCGTGGDRSHTVNISTMAAVVAAAAGARVAKHGNRAASSQSGSADMLEALGVVIDLPAAAAAEAGGLLGITFCFAPVFHPAMRHIGPIRRELGIRTVFNVLGPLANPAHPAAQVLGVPTEAIGELMSGVLAARGTKALVVHGDDGLDELTVYSTSTVWDLTGEEPRRVTLDPTALGIPAPGPRRPARRIRPAQRPGVPHPAGQPRRPGGRRDPRRRLPERRCSPGGLLRRRGAASRSPSPRHRPTSRCASAAALPAAREALSSGAARALLDQWISTSQDLQP